MLGAEIKKAGDSESRQHLTVRAMTNNEWAKEGVW